MNYCCCLFANFKAPDNDGVLQSVYFKRSWVLRLIKAQWSNNSTRHAYSILSHATSLWSYRFKLWISNGFYNIVFFSNDVFAARLSRILGCSLTDVLSLTLIRWIHADVDSVKMPFHCHVEAFKLPLKTMRTSSLWIMKMTSIIHQNKSTHFIAFPHGHITDPIVFWVNYFTRLHWYEVSL
jgi:hypothetical protein